MALSSHAQCSERNTGCDNERMSDAQNSGGTGVKAPGRPWPRGVSGNPGGRPQGLAKATRELVGEDGHRLAEFWFSIMQDETRRDSDRLEASRLLADRGWGKAPTFAAIEEEDPLGLEAMEQAAEEFRASILRLAADSESDTELRS